MLQACLNGDRTRADHAAVPLTADELARDAVAVVRAGARELHVHPRGPDGAESLAAADIAAALSAIRLAVPGTPVGVSTRSPIRPGGRARHAAMRAWSALPDYVSVNLVEEDAPDVIALMSAMGVRVEAGLWSPADAARFVALDDASACLRVLIEINEQNLADALKALEGVIAILDASGSRLPRLLHGYDATMWPLYREALRRGLDARIGFEDGLDLPNGRARLRQRGADRGGGGDDLGPSRTTPPVKSRARRAPRRNARRRIEIEPRIETEGGAVVEEAAAGAFRFGQDLIGLLQSQRREGGGQQATGLGGDLADVLDHVGGVLMDHRQPVGLGGRIEGFVQRGVVEATGVVSGASGDRVAAALLERRSRARPAPLSAPRDSRGSA